MKKVISLAIVVMPCLLVSVHVTPTTAATVHRRSATHGAQAAPSGQVLLQRMRSAIQRSGSFHFTASFTISIPGISNTSVGIEGDQSIRNNAAHAFITTKGGGQSGNAGLVPAGRMEIIVVGKRYAQRSGRRPWKCQAATSVQPLLQSVAGAGKVGNPQTLGAKTMSGVLTWRVRARTTTSFRGFNLVGPINYYISQHDFTLVRVTARATIRSSFGDLRERQAISYSRYGAPVQVQLPPACAR